MVEFHGEFILFLVLNVYFNKLKKWGVFKSCSMVVVTKFVHSQITENQIIKLWSGICSGPLKKTHPSSAMEEGLLI